MGYPLAVQDIRGIRATTIGTGSIPKTATIMGIMSQTQSPAGIKIYSTLAQALSLPLLLCLCWGCSPVLAKRGEYTAAYRSGNFVQAEEVLSKTIAQEIPFCDYRQSKDAVWLLLDRATTRFASGHTKGAIEDYRLAIEAIDFYNQRCTAELFGQLVIQDDIEGYPGEDFEQVLARVYFALALIQNGDDSNGYALLRQAEEVQQTKRETYARNTITEGFELVDNAAAKYLMALILEERGDISNADILYRQAAELSGLPYNGLPKRNRDDATVIILCHNGNAPFKVTTYSDGSVVSAMALELFLASQNVPPACSTLTGIPVPMLMQTASSEPIPMTASIDCHCKPLEKLYDVGAAAYFQLKQKMPIIAARGAARLLMRRTAVGFAQNQDPNIGVLVDFGMLLANCSTKADTRSWTTLPSSIDFVRFEVAAGEHMLRIATGSGTHEYPLRLAPRSLYIVNIFNIQPGIMHVLIPHKIGDRL